MTETNTNTPKPPPEQARQPQRHHRRTRAELDALRILAREAVLGGESLASIRARLHIPVPTLTVWAQQDGYRQADLKARAEAAEEAVARGEGEAEAMCQQAEELWQMCEEMQDRPTTGARPQVDLARARLLAFGRAGTGEMERFQT